MTNLIKYPSRKTDSHFIAPASVKTVSYKAFQNVPHLTKLEFGSNLTTLRSSAIVSLKNLKSIAINSKQFRRAFYSSISNCERLAVIVGPGNYAARTLANSTGATLITI